MEGWQDEPHELIDRFRSHLLVLCCSDRFGMFVVFMLQYVITASVDDKSFALAHLLSVFETVSEGSYFRSVFGLLV